MGVFALIPARGGSKGLPRKNIRSLAGLPLIAYTIKAALNSQTVSRVFVSTEDDEIAAIAKEQGAEVMQRSAELASDTATSNAVVKDACEQWGENPPDIVVYLQATDIFRRKGIIDECVNRLRRDSEVDTAFAAYPDHKNFWSVTAERVDRLGDFPDAPRQSKPAIYREDTGIACATRFEVAREWGRIGGRIQIVPHPETFSFIDIHDEQDLWLAEVMVQKFRGTGRYEWD